METAVMQDAPPQKTRDQIMAEFRTLIPAIGVREAARQLGINESTATTWSARYGFTAHPSVQQALTRIPRGAPLVVQPTETNGGILLANAMVEDAIQGRAAALRATRKALSHMATHDAETLCDKDVAQTLHTHVKSASIAGGYAADSRPDSPGKTFGSRETGLTIDADVIPEVTMEDPAFG